MTPEEISTTYDGWILLRRWAATWLDTMLLAGFLVGPFLLDEKIQWIGFGLGLLVLAFYYPVLEGWRGITFGKLLCGLRVVNAEGKPPGYIKASIRTFLRLFEINPALMGGIPAAASVMGSPSRQRLGDKAANTYVLKVEDLPRLSSPGLPPHPSLSEFSLPLGLETSASSAFLPPPPAPPIPTKRVLWGLPGALLTTLVAVIAIPLCGREFEISRKTHLPVKLTASKFLAAPPKEGWYHLTGCQLDFANLIWRTLDEDGIVEPEVGSLDEEATSEPEAVDELLVPVFDTLDFEDRKTSLLVASRDPELLKAIDDLRKAGRQGPAAIDGWSKANFERLTKPRELKGTLQSAADFSPDIISTASTAGKLVTDYVVLKEGDEPTDERTVVFVLLVVVGFVGAGAFWVIVLINASGSEQQPARPRRRPA